LTPGPLSSPRHPHPTAFRAPVPRPARAAYGGRVRRPLTADDVEELYARARTPEEHRATAQRLAAWAEQPDPRAADVSPALLLVSAGEHLTEAGDHGEAVACFRRAVEAGQYVPPDVRCYLHGGLLRVGDLDAARDMADELRRERPIDGDVYLLIGENYESTGDLRTAHRWLTMGVQRAVNDVEDGDDLDAAEDAAGLMAARLRVRHALDLPLDEYDRVVASALLAARERSS
jgi:tetratricopeptide (TPR) repeat protein